MNRSTRKPIPSGSSRAALHPHHPLRLAVVHVVMHCCHAFNGDPLVAAMATGNSRRRTQAGRGGGVQHPSRMQQHMLWSMPHVRGVARGVSRGETPVRPSCMSAGDGTTQHRSTEDSLWLPLRSIPASASQRVQAASATASRGNGTVNRPRLAYPKREREYIASRFLLLQF